MKIYLRRRHAPTIGHGAFSHKINKYYIFLEESKSRRTAKSHYRINSYSNFAEKSEFFLLDKVVKLVGGGSVINGAYPI